MSYLSIKPDDAASEWKEGLEMAKNQIAKALSVSGW